MGLRNCNYIQEQSGTINVDDYGRGKLYHKMGSFIEKYPEVKTLDIEKINRLYMLWDSSNPNFEKVKTIYLNDISTVDDVIKLMEGLYV